MGILILREMLTLMRILVMILLLLSRKLKKYFVRQQLKY